MLNPQTRQAPEPLSLQSVIYANPDYYPPMINAAAVLDHEGITQQILCNNFYSPLAAHGDPEYPPSTRIERIVLATKSSGGKYSSFIAQVLRHGDPKAALFIGYDMHGLLPARLLATRFRRPLVYHNHDFVGPDQKLTRGQKIVKMFERVLARTADLVIVPDGERAEFVREQLGLRDCPLVVANAPLQAPSADDRRLSKALEGRGKRFERVVLRQGYIGRGHVLEQTIHSIPLWKDARWGFVIIGPGEEDYKQSLRQLAGEMGVADRFEILPPVDYGEVSQFTSGADLGHALYEPLHVNNRFITLASNKIMEYMAAGLPVLLSESSGSRTLLSRYNMGLAAQDDSLESIAATVNAILGNPELAVRLGQASKQAFTEEFNYAHQYAPAIEKFRELARKRR